jgi:hypothetical protein
MRLYAAIVCVALIGASAARADNLSTCLNGQYPALCNKALLTPQQRAQAEAAERSANLQICLEGSYRALCRHELLTPSEARRVQVAEHDANLRLCLEGNYRALCDHSLLTTVERNEVYVAEKRANLAICLKGDYPTLCDHSSLTDDQSARVREAEQMAARRAQAPHPRQGRSTSNCDSGHWVEAVMSDGQYVKLEDGSLWEILSGDAITTALWLPTTEIVVCDGKLINTDDNETVDARRIR